MKNQTPLSALIARSKEALQACGFKKRTMEMYHYYGFILIQRYYDKQKESYYSEELTRKFVLRSRTEYDNGNIGIKKFQYIRKVADM
ncbi:MAG: hypothetical protein FIA99_06320, partial [Ruminiclostridium sp.]|nr:hypothetical protein [Ruminiclostridium sp.]